MKTRMTPKKLIASLVAIAMAMTILFGGTFAWQSISQEALNEIKGVTNPGGRLHDDFKNISFDVDAEGMSKYTTKTFDKDVYVENFTSVLNEGVQVYARVRLDEYMEIGKGAGAFTQANEAESLVPTATLGDKTSWTTYVPGNNNVFRTYWTWTHNGGSAVYMPTFNKDNTSLAADVNGTWNAGFADHKDYNVGDTESGEAYYAPNVEGGAQIIINETHTAQETLHGDVITMAQWLQLDDSAKTGSFWVWDADGWAYWADPIMPSTATGLLLDQIQRTEVPIEGEWYYGVNVVAQFITADDLGKENGTGFYDTSKGANPPSDEALSLLQMIGVITGEVSEETTENKTLEVASESELIAALKQGGNILLTADIELKSPVVVKNSTTLDLGEYKIYNNTVNFREGSEGARRALLTVSGESVMLAIDNGRVEAKENDCYAVRVEEGATAIIWGGNYIGNVAAVFVDAGQAVIHGGDFSIRETLSDGDHSQMLNCKNNSNASIVVYGGSFLNFDPSDANDGDLVAEGYTVSPEAIDGGTTRYHVVKADPEADESETETGEDPEVGENGENLADGSESVDDSTIEDETAGDGETDGNTAGDTTVESDETADDGSGSGADDAAAENTDADNAPSGESAGSGGEEQSTDSAVDNDASAAA